MESFVTGTGDFQDDEDPNDPSPELDVSIATPPSLTGGFLDEGNLNVNGETDFMAFLRLIEKLTNDIRRLDQKILEERDKNQVLLEQNCRSKFENSNLKNKIKGKFPVGTTEQKEDVVHAASQCREADFTTGTKGAIQNEMASYSFDKIKQEAIQKIQAQWNACLEERRKKYEQYKVASNLNCTRQNSEDRIPPRIGKAMNPDVIMLTEKKTQKRTTSVSIVDGVSSEKAKPPLATQELHTWKMGTVLIMGDSMLHGIDERRMSKNGLVKVRCFPGSTVADLKNFYMQPLLSKKPSHVIMHIGTNDAANKDSTADIILNSLLDIKKEIEATLPNVTVTVSTPIKRTDKSSAGKTIDELNRKIRSLRLSTVDNNNIGFKEIGRKGLHLNDKGVSKLASNLVAKLRSI